jgi:glycosyltransferase involved in cell wall biosynthesis
MQNFENHEPLVSICIPVYNSENTIGKTIASILNQTFKNIEIIIIDNNSTDSTIKIIEEFDDPRIRLILNEIHFPFAEYNWNRCFEYVHGELMAIFHADDVYLPDMISRQIETFKKNPSAGSVFTLANIINENDEIVGEFKLPPNVKGLEPYTYYQIFTSILEEGCFLICPSAIIRTSLYIKLSPFRYDQFGSASDLDMWLRAAECAPLIILDEKLMNYRISKSQETYVLNRLRIHEAEFFKVMDFHIEKNKNNFEISKDTKDKYDMLRFKDQIICVFGYGYKGDFKNFIIQMKQIPWKKYLKIHRFYWLIIRLIIITIRHKNANPYGLMH